MKRSAKEKRQLAQRLALCLLATSVSVHSPYPEYGWVKNTSTAVKDGLCLIHYSLIICTTNQNDGEVRVVPAMEVYMKRCARGHSLLELELFGSSRANPSRRLARLTNLDKLSSLNNRTIRFHTYGVIYLFSRVHDDYQTIYDAIMSKIIRLARFLQAREAVAALNKLMTAGPRLKKCQIKQRIMLSRRLLNKRSSLMRDVVYSQ